MSLRVVAERIAIVRGEGTTDSELPVRASGNDLEGLGAVRLRIVVTVSPVDLEASCFHLRLAVSLAAIGRKILKTKLQFFRYSDVCHLELMNCERM